MPRTLEELSDVTEGDIPLTPEHQRIPEYNERESLQNAELNPPGVPRMYDLFTPVNDPDSSYDAFPAPLDLSFSTILTAGQSSDVDTTADTSNEQLSADQL